MAIRDRDRDRQKLEEIAEQFDTTPDALIEGRSDVHVDQIPKELLNAAALCPCNNCGKVIGCEHTYCANCP